MNQCVNASTRFSPAQLMFTLNRDAVADLSGGVQDVNMAEQGKSISDIQGAVSGRRAKAAENLTKAAVAMTSGGRLQPCTRWVI